MSDTLPSIITYSEDIDSAEAPPALPAGTYTGTIREAKPTDKKDGSGQYAAVAFFIPADQYPADFVGGDPDGTIIIYRRVQLADTHRGRWQMKKWCEAIGAPMPKRDVDLTAWVGLDAKLEIVHETFEGEPRATIKSVTAI